MVEDVTQVAPVAVVAVVVAQVAPLAVVAVVVALAAPVGMVMGMVVVYTRSYRCRHRSRSHLVLPGQGCGTVSSSISLSCIVGL